MLVGFIVGFLTVLVIVLILKIRRTRQKLEERSNNITLLPFKVIKSSSNNGKEEEEGEKKRTVAVLGASGFVGSHVVEALIESGKYKVYMLGRKFEQESVRNLFPKVHGVFQVDIMNYSSLLQAFKGVDSIIDCTAVVQTVHVTPNKAWYIKVTGTNNVLMAAMETGVKNAVFIMGNDSGVKEGMHDDFVRYLGGVHTSLNAILKTNGQDNIATSVVKFGMIYGTRSTLCDGIMSGNMKYLPKTNDKASFIPVEYAAQVILKVEERLHERNEQVCGQEIKLYGVTSSMKEFLSLAEWGSGIAIHHSPLSLLWALSSVNVTMVSLFDWAPFGDQLCPFLCELLAVKESESDRTIARKVLDLHDEIPSIRDGVEEMVKKYNHEKKK